MQNQIRPASQPIDESTPAVYGDWIGIQYLDALNQWAEAMNKSTPGVRHWIDRSHPPTLPPKINLGSYSAKMLYAAMVNSEYPPFRNFQGLPRLMGFLIPPWQRGLVWTQDQNRRLIESILLGLPIGTYAYVEDNGSPYDGWLIDGQQRMNAIQGFIHGKFTVFDGLAYADLSDQERRARWNAASFPAYVLSGATEADLRDYYDRLNHGGTAH